MTEFAVPSSTTDTIQSGTQYWGDPVTVDGQLNTAGQLNVAPAEATAATGITEGIGAGTTAPERTTLAAGLTESVGTATTIRERTTLAAGIAEASGAAATARERTTLATGVGIAGYFDQPTRIESGTVEKLARLQSDDGTPLYIGGEFRIAGEYRVGAAPDLKLADPLIRRDTIDAGFNERDEIKASFNERDDLDLDADAP